VLDLKMKTKAMLDRAEQKRRNKTEHESQRLGSQDRVFEESQSWNRLFKFFKPR